MADNFFGFDTSLSGNCLEDGLDGPLADDDEIGEEEEYDALNDETFGAAVASDWEKDHEKLAEIAESSRPNYQNSSKKNGVNINVEESLSHLVLDEKVGIVPRPGVWDSPSNFPLTKSQPPPPLSSALKNVCTVEELERGLIANTRPPPGLTKPVQQKSDSSLLFEALSLNDKLQINGLPPPPCFPPGLGLPGPHSVVMPPNIRMTHPQFLQNSNILPNQAGNILRYPFLPPLIVPHGAQRRPIHGAFVTNFPQPPHPNLPPQFSRGDHPMIPSFSNNQNNQQYSHSGNQRNQNKFFHHEQHNHQPFFKNNQYPHNRNNQRYHQYQHHSQNSNGTNNSNEYDEYAGLMSSREKQWLTNIQLLQLNTNQPYIDDYYYTVFCDRQNKQNESQNQKDKKHQNNNGYHRDSRDKDQPQVLSKTVYTPTQFENSLGKLQCGSVTAPRKIIDMDVVPNSEPHSNIAIQQKDNKKTRQLLLEIERLYTIQLKLEDLTNPLALLNEQQQQQQQDGENENGNVKKTAPELINMMWIPIMKLIQDDKLASMLSIRKAKMLVLRFLPCINIKEYSNQLEELWVGILKGLAIIGRRDSHLLPNFYPDFRNWLSSTSDFNILLRLAKAMSDSTGQSAKNNSLLLALTNKFGISVIALMIKHAEELFPTDESVIREWSTFIINIDDLIGDSLPSVAPYHPIPTNTLTMHLRRIAGLKIERYSPLQLLFSDSLII